MNRVLVVARRDPGLDELEETAKTLYSKIGGVRQNRFISDVFKSLARVYVDLKSWNHQKNDIDIFGLRDFYNLVKNVANGIKAIKDFENIDKTAKEMKVCECVLMGINRNFSFQIYRVILLFGKCMRRS